MRFTIRLCSYGIACITTQDSKICGVELASTPEQALFQAMLRFQKVNAVKVLTDGDIITANPFFKSYFEEMIANICAIINGASLDDFPMIYNNFMFLVGTTFQKLVWTNICKIKSGETASYKDLATQVCKPEAVRAVATACGKNPIAILVPCHRVIKSNNDIGQYHWGNELKKHLLDREKFLKPIDWNSVDAAIAASQARSIEIRNQVDEAIANAKQLLNADMA